MRGVWVPLSMGFSAFEKIKCIFSIASVGNLGKLRECFSLTLTGRCARRHRTLALASGVLSVPGSVTVEHRTHCTGRRVFPIHASGVA